MRTLKILIMVMVTGVMVTGVFLLSLCSFAWAGPQDQFKGQKANPYNPGQEEKQKEVTAPTSY